MFRPTRGHPPDGGEPGGGGGGGAGARGLCRLRLSSSLLLLDTAGGGRGGGRHPHTPPARGARPGRGVFVPRSQQTRRESRLSHPLRPPQASMSVRSAQSEAGSVYNNSHPQVH